MVPRQVFCIYQWNSILTALNKPLLLFSINCHLPHAGNWAKHWRMYHRYKVIYGISYFKGLKIYLGESRTSYIIYSTKWKHGTLLSKIIRNSRQQQQSLRPSRVPFWVSKPCATAQVTYNHMKLALNEMKMNTYWAFLCDRCNVLNSLLHVIWLNPHSDFVGWLLLPAVY